MKKMLMLLLILCSICFGCGVERLPSDSAEQESISVETEKKDDTEVPKASTASALPKETTTEQRKSALLPKLYEKYGDCRGAYLLPITLEEEESMICMECYQEELFVLSVNTGLHMRVLNLETGEITADRMLEFDCEGTGDGGYLSDGSIWVYAPARKKVYYMDRNLETLEEEELPEGNNWHLDKEEDTLWFWDWDCDTVSSYDIVDRNYQDYNMETEAGRDLGICGVDWDVKAVSHGRLYFIVTDENLIREGWCFIPSERRVERKGFINSMNTYFYEDGSGYQIQKQYRIMDYASPEQLISIPITEPDEYITNYQQGYLISETSSHALIYNCSNGNCYGAYELERYESFEEEEKLSNYISTIAVRPREQQIIFSFEAPGRKKLVLYDLDLAEITGRFTCSRDTEEELLQKVKQDWNGLKENYGIDMITVEEAEENPDWSGYHLEPDSNLLNYLDACEIFCDFLDTLPDGMVSEVFSPNSEKLEVCFTHSITGEEESGALSSAGGYVTSVYDEKSEKECRRMVIDMSDPQTFVQYLPHEFFHLMENRFWDCETEIYLIQDGMKEREGELTPGEKIKESIILDWAVQWADMSPDDGYIYDLDESLCYNSDYEMDYVYMSEPDMEQVYFVDSYSRTFPNEDRARIFEYLYMEFVREQDADWLKYEHLREKSRYLCQLIRCCYPSADGEEKNPWEEVLSEEDWNKIRENRQQRLGRSG